MFIRNKCKEQYKNNSKLLKHLDTFFSDIFVHKLFICKPLDLHNYYCTVYSVSILNS